MKSIDAENNLAETAFIVPDKDVFQIRWFTPTIEVDLGGHATLASAHVLFKLLNYNREKFAFISPRSGNISVTKKYDLLYLDFPIDKISPANDKRSEIKTCFNINPIEVY